jgi:hypothetical protein
LEKDFEDFIVKRCSDALMNDTEYEEASRRDCDIEEIIDIVVRIGYKKGFSDACKVKECSEKM